MIITILLWGVIILAGLGFINCALECKIVGTLISILVLWLAVTGLNRNEVNDICNAINQVGGEAVYLSGQCLIKNDGGIPIDKENSRLVYFSQQ